MFPEVDGQFVWFPCADCYSHHSLDERGEGWRGWKSGEVGEGWKSGEVGEGWKSGEVGEGWKSGEVGEG